MSINTTMTWYPAESNICEFVLKQTEEVNDMANKWVLGVFALNLYLAPICFCYKHVLWVPYLHEEYVSVPPGPHVTGFTLFYTGHD